MKLHIPSLLQGFEIELIFALPCMCGTQFEILADFFKFPYLGMKCGI